MSVVVTPKPTVSSSSAPSTHVAPHLPPSCPVLKPKTINIQPQPAPITPTSKNHPPLNNSNILRHL